MSRYKPMRLQRDALVPDLLLHYRKRLSTVEPSFGNLRYHKHLGRFGTERIWLNIRPVPAVASQERRRVKIELADGHDREH